MLVYYQDPKTNRQTLLFMREKSNVLNYDPGIWHPVKQLYFIE